ncbi:MAG TPA: hypothetical protein VKB18_10230 [Gemmatimonadota bacterium]|nr:hypothetical protein [Gemmatimonadota bacterium]
MPGTVRNLLEARWAVAAAAIYLVVALGSLLLPTLTGSDLAGVWSILLTLPWSAIFPLGTVNHAAPGLAGPARFLLLLGGIVLDTVLVYLGIRWAAGWIAARRR